MELIVGRASGDLEWVDRCPRGKRLVPCANNNASINNWVGRWVAPGPCPCAASVHLEGQAEAEGAEANPTDVSAAETDKEKVVNAEWEGGTEKMDGLRGK
jgi:hypothetical protein